MARTDLKGHAELRLWDLQANSTRYDYLLAAPSDEQLTKYWTAWAVISLAGGLFVGFFLVAILSSRSAVKRPFNLYLIYLMIPDAIYSTLCGIVCLLNALNGAQMGHAICNFQMMFIVWGVGSNMWLNAAVSNQLHRMLKDSLQIQRYTPPTRQYVSLQAISIYGFCLFLGTWGLIEYEEFPHYVASTSGLACLPVEQDWKSSIYFWVVFFPLFGGIPVAYVHYVCFDIWKNNLLPPRGKRRLLAVYFGRIVIVFVLMWVPYMILLFVLATWMPAWVHFAGGTLSHLQGAVSAMLCLLKPDIALAVRNFCNCQCNHGDRPLQQSSFSRRRRQRSSSRQSSVRTSWRLFFFNPSSQFTRSFRGHATEPTFGSHIANQHTSTIQQQFSEALWPEENGTYIEDEEENVVLDAVVDPVAKIREEMNEEEEAEETIDVIPNPVTKIREEMIREDDADDKESEPAVQETIVPLKDEETVKANL